MASPRARAESGWEIRFTPRAERWYVDLTDRKADAIAAAFDELARLGPATRRPAVGLIKASRHHNMKEVRSFGGHLRAFFAFNRDRRAIVLLGGDKTGEWNAWYRRMVPVADKLYETYLRSDGKGGSAWPIARPGPRPGPRSGGRER